ncbi:hypothetical protein Ahy_B08g089223 [Arachis hypogaea]|uniref:Uncharacterized protein n=1 Tax=Arachis hypogaea TaxID=3818 RepID=A0A444XXN7_ARAHY|nr:hypothetical protein Ahy_B08g089223 [Arachis hypogaea]
MARLIKRKFCWVIRQYNSSHTCTRITISQDYAKLNSYMIAKMIKLLVEAGPLLKPSIVVKIETALIYRENEMVENIRIMIGVFWSFYPCIRVLRSYKPIV